MTKLPALGHDQEEPLPPSRSRRQGKIVAKKKETKKPGPQKAPKNTSVARAKTSLEKSLANQDAQVRITERAYELYHRRGCHHGQDLDDWLTAEREVLSEKSCS